MMLTLPEAARELRSGEPTIKRRVAGGDLKTLHIGRSIHIERAELEAFVNRRQDQ